MGSDWARSRIGLAEPWLAEKPRNHKIGCPPTDNRAPESVRNGGDDNSQEVSEQLSDFLRSKLKHPDETSQVVTQIISRAESFSGPLPHPGHLRAYNDVAPGSAQELLNMAKLEQKHRHHMQRSEMMYPYLGQVLGFVGFVSSVVGAYLLALNGHDVVASAMLGVPCLGVVG